MHADDLARPRWLPSRRLQKGSVLRPIRSPEVTVAIEKIDRLSHGNESVWVCWSACKAESDVGKTSLRFIEDQYSLRCPKNTRFTSRKQLVSCHHYIAAYSAHGLR